MIGWLTSKLGLYLIGGAAILAVLGTVWWKIDSYIEAHDELVSAYDRQALELNQAAEVNRNNVTEIAHIKAEHSQTLAQLNGQLDSEATTMTELEMQLARLRSLEPEVRIETVTSSTECAPTYDVHPALADPFGMRVEPSG